MQIEGWNGNVPTPAILKAPAHDGKPVSLWTGKQVFSVFTPNVNLQRFSFEHPDSEREDQVSPGDTQVRIEAVSFDRTSPRQFFEDRTLRTWSFHWVVSG